METEYLDVVNKELHEIERFFQQMYPPCPEHAGDNNSGITPFINFPIHTSLDASNADSAGVESDEYLVDLKERYKQLKTIQDRLHIELTTFRIWKQTGGDRQLSQDCRCFQQQRHHDQQTEPMTKANATNVHTSTKQHSASSYSRPSFDTATQDLAPERGSGMFKLFVCFGIVYLLYGMIEFVSVNQPKSEQQHITYAWPRN